MILEARAQVGQLEPNNSIRMNDEPASCGEGDGSNSGIKPKTTSAPVQQGILQGIY